MKRNRKGAITIAIFRPVSGANPLRRSAHVGTRYSYKEQVGEDSGYSAWRHRDLVHHSALETFTGEAVDAAQADLFVRAVFRAVPLSCMKRPARRPAPVSFIDRFHPKHHA